ncbi:hypothetical protein [Bacteroides neonati]|uniref:hypothetical protein n=1 Tax=Bacteroides neonati TaxID=1347393 RepID=UPI0004B04AE6|nr:hypothetical protein [Bacteroides neonati]
MDNCRITEYISHCKQVISFLGLLTYSCYILAQPLPFSEDSTAKKQILILHAGIGFSPSASNKGESIWEDADNKSTSGLSYSFRLMSYSQKKVIGYGVYFYDFTHHKNHYLSNQLIQAKENTRITYVAPQISFIKRETAFANCFGLIDFGIGYLRYISDTQFKLSDAYKAEYSGICINLNIGYEYAFAKYWGAKIEAGAIYAPIKPRNKYSSLNNTLQSRSRINLFLPSLQIGLSYYL